MLSQHNQENLRVLGNVFLFTQQRVIAEKHHGPLQIVPTVFQLLSWKVLTQGMYQKVCLVIMALSHCDLANIRFILKYKVHPLSYCFGELFTPEHF